MGELTRGERLQIMLTDEELVALDDWRFAKRMPSQRVCRSGSCNLSSGLVVRGLRSYERRTEPMLPKSCGGSSKLPNLAVRSRA